MASAIPTPFNFRLPCTQNIPLELTTTTRVIRPKKPSRRKQSVSSYNTAHFHFNSQNSDFKLKLCSQRTVISGACSDGCGGGGTIDAGPQQQASAKIKETDRSASSFGDSYVGLFVRMLGLDNDPPDREQAVVALWQYSLGGRKCIDNIMQFRGCINLVVNLLQSESCSAREAAAGLLRSISSVHVYRDVVAESGAIEEITGLLCQLSLTSEVKEQSICILWNLSVDENLRVKIANPDILPLLIKSLDDEDMRVKEASGGVLANLALTHSNHSIMVEAGIIPKLGVFMKKFYKHEALYGASFLKSSVEEESKVIRKEARNALVELCKNEYYRILVLEEGLVPVPLIGSAAYKSFSPSLHSWPRLPDGTQIERTSKGPSRFGASELLLGLNVGDKNANLEEAKMKAIIGRSKQQFLARSGAIEVEDTKSNDRQFTLLPWIDGVARLVLILELEDESAICRAAESIADASVNERLRNSFKEAGAVKNLIHLLNHNSNAIKLAAIDALEKFSISNVVFQTVEAEGIMDPLINILKNSDTSKTMMEKVLNLLARILDPNREMKLTFYDGPVNGFKKELDASRGHDTSSGLTTKVDEMFKSKTNARKDSLDSDVIARLVDLLNHPSPDFQRKAATVLEFAAIINSSMDPIILANIESGLKAVFQQVESNEMEFDDESLQTMHAVQVEETGLAVSAASRLLTKLLDLELFQRTINSADFIKLLRKILKSSIPLQYKDWVAASLVKLSSLYGPTPILQSDNPINMEVTLHETIPRLIQQINLSMSLEAQEAAVVELNRIISEGLADATRAVASDGGIFPLVKLLEEGSERTVEAALSILYNLSMDDENHAAIIAAGAVAALRRIILSERSPWKRALRLLRNLPT